MQWITSQREFEGVRLEANTCKYIDSRRYSTDLELWIFDDACLITSDFGRVIQFLLSLSGDQHADYIVLVPDPVWYFREKFGKYPAVQIDAGDSAEDYLAMLNEDPGNSPADAIGTNWWETVIVPPSRSWFVHMLRDSEDNGGHLWIPQDWAPKVRAVFASLRNFDDEFKGKRQP